VYDRYSSVQIIVSGRGEVFHDKKYLCLVQDFLKSAVEQINPRFRVFDPAQFVMCDHVKGQIDLSSIKKSFVGDNSELGEDDSTN
jgi:hypothetical protein